jgi:hypothetical protein
MPGSHSGDNPGSARLSDGCPVLAAPSRERVRPGRLRRDDPGSGNDRPSRETITSVNCAEESDSREERWTVATTGLHY